MTDKKSGHPPCNSKTCWSDSERMEYLNLHDENFSKAIRNDKNHKPLNLKHTCTVVDVVDGKFQNHFIYYGKVIKGTVRKVKLRKIEKSENKM